MPYMYILKCSDGTYYVGSTWNLSRRLKQHQKGNGANYTKGRLPVKLTYFEKFTRIDRAYFRERQIHSWSHDKEEALINKDINKLKTLAKKKFRKNID